MKRNKTVKQMEEQTLTKRSSGSRTYLDGVPFQLKHQIVISVASEMHHVSRKQERLPQTIGHLALLTTSLGLKVKAEG